MTKPFDVGAHLAQARAIIRKCGWLVQAVAPHPGQPGPRVAYTAGLTDAGLPELIIVGLDIRLMQDVLNGAARRHLATEISAGDQLDGLASVAFRAVEADDTWSVAVARKLYGNDRVRLLQLVWPDKDGFYPGEPGWSLGDYQKLPAEDDAQVAKYRR